MIRFLLCLTALAAMALPARADVDSATITSLPSPAESNKPVTISIKVTNGKDYGQDVFFYSWITVNNQEYRAANWDDTNVQKFKMTKVGDAYTYTIPDISQFYYTVVNDALTADVIGKNLKNATAINFIAKSSHGYQTQDLHIDLIHPQYSGGSGTESDPWQIKTTADLLSLAQNSSHWAAGNVFVFYADVDAAGLTTPIGNTTTPFAATVHGCGHVISGLSLTNTKLEEPTGLFGATNQATIEDLCVRDAEISGTAHTGILVGQAENSTIVRCYTTGNVTASSICAGGLVGLNSGSIRDCYSTASVASSSYAVGGLVGKNTGTIERTIASGNIEGYDYVGGLVGANYSVVTHSVAANATVTTDSGVNYGARFGGNNNAENSIENNHAWSNMKAGHSEWSDFGDHATLQNAATLYKESRFKELTQWDFDTVWRWETRASRAVAEQSPVLRVHGFDQPLIFPAAMFDAVTGIESVGAADGGIAVGPNPTDGPVSVSAAEGLGICRVYSLSGALVASTDGHGAPSVELSIAHCPQGVYILTVATTSGSRSFKLIKK